MDSHDKIFLDMYILRIYAPKAPKQNKNTEPLNAMLTMANIRSLQFQNNLNQPASTDHNPPHAKINIFFIPTSFPTKSSFAKPLFSKIIHILCLIISSVLFPSFSHSAFGTNAFTVFQGPSMRIIAGSAIACTSSLNGNSMAKSGTRLNVCCLAKNTSLFKTGVKFVYTCKHLHFNWLVFFKHKCNTSRFSFDISIHYNCSPRASLWNPKPHYSIHADVSQLFREAWRDISDHSKKQQ